MTGATQCYLYGYRRGPSGLNEFTGVIHRRDCRQAPATDDRLILDGIFDELEAHEARDMTEEFAMLGRVRLPLEGTREIRTLVGLKVCKACRPTERAR